MLFGLQVEFIENKTVFKSVVTEKSLRILHIIVAKKFKRLSHWNSRSDFPVVLQLSLCNDKRARSAGLIEAYADGLP